MYTDMNAFVFCVLFTSHSVIIVTVKIIILVLFCTAASGGYSYIYHTGCLSVVDIAVCLIVCTALYVINSVISQCLPQHLLLSRKKSVKFYRPVARCCDTHYGSH